MNKRNKEMREELFRLREPIYQEFSSSLIPGVENIIGVRIPKIRSLAEEIAKEDPFSFLENADGTYFEEIMLQGMVIGKLKGDIATILEKAEVFIPKIDNWSVCDSFCSGLKITKNNKTKVWEFMIPYLKSANPYEIRFVVVMILTYYIEEAYLGIIFEIFDEIDYENYYVKMAVAWAVSMCFVKYPDETFGYLRKNNLDKYTYNKALQKIRESLKVDKDTKEIIKSMKRF